MFGFIIIRHANSKKSDYYWKECYTSIRKFYDNPIVIIDDSSTFLNENIVLTNCTVIYDKEHKGAGEILPYYYFHKLKPFDTAVIIHDSVFIQRKIDFCTENATFLWTFEHTWDYSVADSFAKLCEHIKNKDEIVELYNKPSEWIGCFGVMSVITWDFLDKMNEKYNILGLVDHIKNRDERCALERLFGVVVQAIATAEVTAAATVTALTYFGEVHRYINWGTTFFDYLTNDYSNYPIMKVWTGR